mgnify:FL=1|jgi:hypothetical protein
MISIVIGDTATLRQGLAKKAISKNAKGVSNFVSFKNKEVSIGDLLTLASQSSDLFSQGTVVLLFDVFAKLEDDIQNELKRLQSSKTLFVFLETEVKSKLDKLEKAGAEVLISPKSKQLIKKDNPFAIANALGLRDRMNTWIILHDLLSHGESGEAVSGIMFWKIKTLLLENNFRKYSKEELEGMVLELPKIIHTGRREGEDLSVSLESFVLQYV